MKERGIDSDIVSEQLEKHSLALAASEEPAGTANSASCFLGQVRVCVRVCVCVPCALVVPLCVCVCVGGV